jgi:hypothetical protein
VAEWKLQNTKQPLLILCVRFCCEAGLGAVFRSYCVLLPGAHSGDGIGLDTGSFKMATLDSRADSVIDRSLLEGFAETRDLVRRLQRVSETEIGELIKPLPPATQKKVIQAFASLFFWATDECAQCLGKKSRGVAECGVCQGSGREGKDISICRLMKRVDELERKAKEDGKSGDVVVAPV